MHWWLVYYIFFLKKRLNKTTKEATLDPHFKPQTYEQELKLQEKGIEIPHELEHGNTKERE